MSRASSRAVAESLRACVRLQRSRVEVAPGLRTGVVIAVILLTAITLGEVPGAVSVAMGALFIAFPDSSEAPRVRLQGMLWGLLWISLAVFLGGTVSGFGVIHVVVAIALAGACGYASALGPRSGLIGVLVLVLFACYAGNIIGVNIAALDAALFALGGIITISVNLAMTPLRRLASVRTGIGRAYLEIAQATQRRGIELAAPTIAAEILSARTVADHHGCAGASAAWVNDLLTDAERARLGLIALLSEESVDHAYVEELATSAGHVANAIAREVEGPLGIPGRRRRSAPADQLRDLEAVVRRAPDPRLVVLAGELSDPLRSAAERLDGPWPIGARADLKRVYRPRQPIMRRLRAHLRLSDVVVEHSLRLMLAFGVATLVAVLLDEPHAYWVPLTVAWIAKPDLSGTVSRVAMRIAGTVAGLVAVSALLLSVRDVPDSSVIVAVAVGLAAATTLAFLWANYPVAVLGITAFVLLLEHLDGSSGDTVIVARLLAPVGAGVWVVFVSSIRPRRASVDTTRALRATNAALRDYARTVQQHGDAEAARARVLATRTTAVATVAAAISEPPGLWERPGTRVDPEQAAAVLTDIIDSTSLILAEELLERHGTEDPQMWQRIDADLDDLDARIVALDGAPA